MVKLQFSLGALLGCLTIAALLFVVGSYGWLLLPLLPVAIGAVVGRRQRKAILFAVGTSIGSLVVLGLLAVWLHEPLDIFVFLFIVVFPIYGAISALLGLVTQVVHDVYEAD